MELNELYSKRELRDARYKTLKAQGMKLRRYTSRNQQLHPMYVEDLRPGLSAEDCGFGNTIYKTYFAVLYGVREERHDLR